MFNINKNISLNQLQEFIKKDIQQKTDYLPDSFQKEQRKALEIFNKRILLENTIEETISFNKKLNWDKDIKNIHLVTSVEELISVFKLRSDIYSNLNYQKEFPNIIEGLNFDNYDSKSAILYCKNSSQYISGTVRIIFDDYQNKLPTEEKLSIKEIRNSYEQIGEISRIIVKQSTSGLNQEFKYLMRGIYNIFILNNIDIAVSVIKSDHLKLYKKLGGVDVIKELNKYGELKDYFSIITYNPNFASKFFKKVFLT